MDGFNIYNHIKIDPSNAEKSSSWTRMDNFHHPFIPFGLENVGATYQHSTTAIFHNMLHDCLEDYVDDIIVKTKKKHHHTEN